MKNINKIGLFAVVFLVLGVTSCDLDRQPKDAIVNPKEALTDVSTARAWDDGLYSQFRNRQYGIYDYTADFQADYLNATKDYGNNGGNPHSWINFTSTDYDLRDIWAGYYSALKNANFILETIPELIQKEQSGLQGADEATQKSINNNISTYKGYEANAHFVRAFYYFELTKRYGTVYNASTASTDLSVPLVLKYDVDETPARATNSDVYAQIFDDLAKAKEIYVAQKVADKPMNDRFSPAACDALEARVRLEMKDYANAFKVAEKLIDSGTFPLVTPSLDNIFNMWRNDSSTEEILQLSVSRPNELPNTHSAYFYDFNYPRYPFVSARWVPTQWMLDLYDESDLRKQVYFSDRYLLIEWNVYSVKTIQKYWGNPEFATIFHSNFPGGVPNSVHKPKVFRIAETYLIAAEAAYMNGDSDNAIKYLNALRVSRGLKPIAGVSGNALFEEIKNERTRELAFEGQRLWDLRRWNMPMERKDPQNVAVLARGLGSDAYYGLKIPAGHPQFVWGIPSNDIQVNPKIVQNPGW